MSRFDLSAGCPACSVPISAVTFVGTAEVLRKVGVVVRDACNGAANTLGGHR